MDCLVYDARRSITDILPGTTNVVGRNCAYTSIQKLEEEVQYTASPQAVVGGITLWNMALCGFSTNLNTLLLAVPSRTSVWEVLTKIVPHHAGYNALCSSKKAFSILGSCKVEGTSA